MDFSSIFDHLSSAFSSHFYPAKVGVMMQGSKAPSQVLQDKYHEVLGWVSNMAKSGYVAGTSNMTLADISFVATYSSIKAMGSVDTRKYPFIEAWFIRCKQQIPKYQEVCGEGAEMLGGVYKKSKAINNRVS